MYYRPGLYGVEARTLWLYIAACYQMAIIIGGSVAQPAKEELRRPSQGRSSVKKLDTPSRDSRSLSKMVFPVFGQAVFNKAITRYWQRMC